MIEPVYFLVGVVISLFCERLPRFSQAFQRLDGEDKQLVVIALSVVVTMVINQIACYGYVDFECKEWSVLLDSFITLTGSQIGHFSSKEILKNVTQNNQ